MTATEKRFVKAYEEMMKAANAMHTVDGISVTIHWSLTGQFGSEKEVAKEIEKINK